MDWAVETRTLGKTEDPQLVGASSDSERSLHVRKATPASREWDLMMYVSK